jgi:cell division protein FtsQ
MTTPPDVKLMNLSSHVLLLVFAALALSALISWAARHPVFAIRGISVFGQTSHNNAVTLRANVAPHISGNFLAIDLNTARQAFEAAPWVRKAVVQREFPNRIRVTLQEHQAVAYWGADRESGLLNNFGEVFEANVGEVEPDHLPRLDGPSGESAQVLSLYSKLQPWFEGLGVFIEDFELSRRGIWQLRLNTGAQLVLGGGNETEVVERTRLFVTTLGQVAARYGRTAAAMEYADLRHPQGYALKLRGVSTLAFEGKKP